MIKECPRAGVIHRNTIRHGTAEKETVRIVARGAGSQCKAVAVWFIFAIGQTPCERARSSSIEYAVRSGPAFLSAGQA